MSSEKGRSDSSGTDPRTLRAVAHPVRLDLLDLLFREGTLTAGRCAELLGLTPKVCSYHLQILGSYGLIEETGTGRGRARPWRLAEHELAYVHEETEDASTVLAADQFARTLLSRDVRLIEDFIAERHDLPQVWRNVATMVNRPMRLPPEQLRALGAELLAVLDRYAGRAGPGGEPSGQSGGHPVHVALYAVPTDLADISAAPDVEGGGHV